MSSLATREPSFIDPARLYSIRGFHAASGISETRVRMARRCGIELPTIEVGKRKFVSGQCAIDYIKQLAAIGG